MKFTSLEQSKKLAKILPLESADTHYKVKWLNNESEIFTIPYSDLGFYKDDNYHYCVPCWSIVALLNILPVSCDNGRHCLALINSNPNCKTEWLCAYEDDNGHLMMECYADTQIDACVEMILKLHESKLLCV